jgi:putative Ca2+/H+ antiporter (TMEM165/GDT1 family)
MSQFEEGIDGTQDGLAMADTLALVLCNVLVVLLGLYLKKVQDFSKLTKKHTRI